MGVGSSEQGTALVTGASSGIGYELTRLFAADGWDVVLVARGRERLEAVAEELAADYGVEGHVFSKDLSEPSAAEELYEAVTDAGHEVDALVNNAGFGSFGPFLEDDVDTDHAMITLHVTTVTTLTKLFGREMAERGGERVLNNASVAGWAPTPSSVVYSGAKHYERAFSEALAEELEPEGITVTALCPGETRTGFFERGDYDEAAVEDDDMMSAREVAEAGYRGMMDGDRLVVPGRLNKFRVFLGRLLPRSLYVKATRRSLNE
jgi:short-subunit dehydrogenase